MVAFVTERSGGVLACTLRNRDRGKATGCGVWRRCSSPEDDPVPARMFRAVRNFKTGMVLCAGLLKAVADRRIAQRTCMV